MQLSNINISNIGNRRNEAIVELAKAIQLLAQAIVEDQSHSYGIYIADHTPKEKDADFLDTSEA